MSEAHKDIIRRYAEAIGAMALAPVMRRGKTWMARTSRAMTACILMTVSVAHAGTYDRARYAVTLHDLAALQTELGALAEKIEAGMTPEEARPLAARADERLGWLRATLTEASIPDRATLRAKDERPYARCIVWLAGDLEDHAQDVATDLSMIARGAARADLIPLDRGEIAAEGPRKGCPG
ncbi:hypothetical protein F2P47_15965 [Parvibaculum sedimenti]|uniref:Uncharacterized protein n=1 Tax=Parvibaculum sedimenti TaxID=2608632 RepID=A0A6N6VJS7_9HYPH|nr:hypothetical protein [Parvibaculum sedimenti]KAB7738753.1 hypothetical protein F2P47_15965 [Parvibaculum sedimenti]